MRHLRIIAVVTIPFILAACGQGGLTKSEGGTVVGAVAGGILGNQIGGGSGKVVATAIGAVVGGIVGSEIGKSLDEADRRRAIEAEYRALEYGPSGQSTSWKNPDNGHYGNVVAGKPYKMKETHCREYTHTIYISGKPETMRGTACRQPDGTWRNIA